MNELISVDAVSFEESLKDDLTIIVFREILDQHISSLIFPKLLLDIDAVNGSDKFA
jgi:hypothetical protein